MLVDHSYDNNITEKSQYHNKISTDFLTFIRENKSSITKQNITKYLNNAHGRTA